MKSSLMKIAETVTLDGAEYQINTDFKIWVEIEELLLNVSAEPWERLAKILALAYPVLPNDPYAAVQGIMWFYSGGADSTPAEDNGRMVKAPCYSLTEDFDYIWGGFMSQYGIDLTRNSMHWWRFKALLACLDERCRFMQIVAYRSMDLSHIKDREQRRFYEKMKKQFRLKSGFDEGLGEELAAEALSGLF